MANLCGKRKVIQYQGLSSVNEFVMSGAIIHLTSLRGTEEQQQHMHILL